jgi:bacterioferritin
MIQSFVSEATDLRHRAHLHIEEAAMVGHHGDCATVVRMLNDARTTGLACVRRSRSHDPSAASLALAAIAWELSEHAADIQELVDRATQRITQLGGSPDYHPIEPCTSMLERPVAGSALVDILEEDLVAHWIAVESYTEIARFLGDDDSTTQRLIEDALECEEDHATDLADILARLGRPASAGPVR